MTSLKEDNVFYSDDEDKTTGGWVYFTDGHAEFWSNVRLQSELNYRGLQFLKTQTKLARECLINSHLKQKEEPDDLS